MVKQWDVSRQDGTCQSLEAGLYSGSSGGRLSNVASRPGRCFLCAVQNKCVGVLIA
jgi:hypothetical protein